MNQSVSWNGLPSIVLAQAVNGEFFEVWGFFTEHNSR